MAEAAKEKEAKERRAREREKAKERERKERDDREARRRKSRSRTRSRSRRRKSKSRSRRRSRSESRRRSRSRARHRSRSGGGVRSISMDNDALRTEVERMSEKLKYMEGRRRWNSVANKKQYLHQVRVRQLCVEDVRKQLEKHFGSKREVPQKIEEVIS